MGSLHTNICIPHGIRIFRILNNNYMLAALTSPPLLKLTTGHGPEPVHASPIFVSYFTNIHLNIILSPPIFRDVAF